MQLFCFSSCFYSLILAFFDGFCLQQLLLWCLSNSDFSSSIVPFTCIIGQNSTVRKSCPVSPIYLFNYFYQYRLMDIYFIVIIHYCDDFLLISSHIWPLGAPSNLFVLLTISHHFLSTFFFNCLAAQDVPDLILSFALSLE